MSPQDQASREREGDRLSANDVVNPEFINRNPRNLEQMGLGRKRKGWPTQYPPREFYHRVVFDKSGRHTTGRLQGADGKTVIAASTNEVAISKHLFSTQDVSAAENVGRILAQRCQESGINCGQLLVQDGQAGTEKFEAFQRALVDGGIDLEEPEPYEEQYSPGMDYDGMDQNEWDQKRYLGLGP